MCLLSTGSRVRVPPGSPNKVFRISSKSSIQSCSHDCLTLTMVEYGHVEADSAACEELWQLQEVECGLPAQNETEVSVHHRPLRTGSRRAQDSQRTVPQDRSEEHTSELQ